MNQQLSLLAADHGDGIVRSAEIDGSYRWTLGRRWADGPVVTWIMLNPSTADRDKDDPTLRRIIAFSKSWGYGALSVVNLFPFRSSSPEDCRAWYADATEETLLQNYRYIRRETCPPIKVIAAWGAADWAMGEISETMPALDPEYLFCIGTNADGSPKHPLARGKHRVSDSQQPIPWRPAQ